MGVKIKRYWDTGATQEADVTSGNSRLLAQEAHTASGTTNPIVKPASGTNYSFWALFRLYFDGVGVGTINNIKFFTDGANGLGTGRGLVVSTAGVFAEATGTEGETGDELTVAEYGNGTTDLNDEPVNAFGLTTGSPLSIDGTITDPEDEAFGDYLVMQASIADTASAGLSPTETMTYRYDSTVSE
jgi:hypothetical protein